MQRSYTDLRKVREIISSLPENQPVVVVIGTQNCKACTQQHMELLKLQSLQPSLQFYHVDGHEWNQTFPSYSISRVPVVYKADSVQGMVVLSDGLMELEKLESFFK